MDELRSDNRIEINFNNTAITGIVEDFEADRVMVKIDGEFLKSACNIKELDCLDVLVHTKLGLKRMQSFVISPLNSNGEIIIENAKSETVDQKREYVRVVSDIVFKLEKDNQTYTCICINISAGGIAFYSNSAKFEIGDAVNIILPEEEFSKTINIGAKIIKQSEKDTVAQFIEIDKHDEDKILKYVFKEINEK